MSHEERAESVRHCKWVDQVVENAPWVIDEEFLIKYEIEYVAHDDLPYSSDHSDDVYEFIKKSGRFIATQRTVGISTTDLITRVLKNHDIFVSRNLKRGVAPHEINLGNPSLQE